MLVCVVLALLAVALGTSTRRLSVSGGGASTPVYLEDSPPSPRRPPAPVAPGPASTPTYLADSAPSAPSLRRSGPRGVPVPLGEDSASTPVYLPDTPHSPRRPSLSDSTGPGAATAVYLPDAAPPTPRRPVLSISTGPGAASPVYLPDTPSSPRRPSLSDLDSGPRGVPVPGVVPSPTYFKDSELPASPAGKRRAFLSGSDSPPVPSLGAPPSPVTSDTSGGTAAIRPKRRAFIEDDGLNAALEEFVPFDISFNDVRAMPAGEERDAAEVRVIQRLTEQAQKHIIETLGAVGAGLPASFGGQARYVRRGWPQFNNLFRAWSLKDFEYLVTLPLEIPLLADFVGENKVGNQRWVRREKTIAGLTYSACYYVAPATPPTVVPLKDSCAIRYFTPMLQKKHSVVFSGGLFARPPAVIGTARNPAVAEKPILLNPVSPNLVVRPGEDKNFVKLNLNPSEGGDFLYVWLPSKQLVVTPFSSSGTTHHSTLAAGKPVWCAGTMRFANGRLTQVSNQSGHYRPHAVALYRFLLFLMQEGVALDDSVLIVLNVQEDVARRITEARSGLNGVAVSEALALVMAKEDVARAVQKTIP